MPSTTFILIPGAGSSAWYWHLVVPRLEQRGFEAVPVELPAADDTAGLPEYAAAVIMLSGTESQVGSFLLRNPVNGGQLRGGRSKTVWPLNLTVRRPRPPHPCTSLT
jgi:hypothetical protein